MIDTTDPKYKKLIRWSNPIIAQRQARKYLGARGELFISTRRDSKYMIWAGHNYVHFGRMGYEDYTLHRDKERRKNYLARSAGITGDWKRDKFSANNLSRNIIW